MQKYCSVVKGLFHSTKERRSSLSSCFLSLRDESVGTIHKLLKYDSIMQSIQAMLNWPESEYIFSKNVILGQTIYLRSIYQ